MSGNLDDDVRSFEDVGVEMLLCFMCCDLTEMEKWPTRRGVVDLRCRRCHCWREMQDRLVEAVRIIRYHRKGAAEADE